MAEWHVTPDYIMNNWTDELFALMCDKLGERKQRELGKKPDKVEKENMVSDTELFKRMGVKVRHGD